MAMLVAPSTSQAVGCDDRVSVNARCRYFLLGTAYDMFCSPKEIHCVNLALTVKPTGAGQPELNSKFALDDLLDILPHPRCLRH
jgi:hypothetical protein